MTPPVLSRAELQQYLVRHFPDHDLSMLRVEEVAPMRVRVRMQHRSEQLRPGGTVSGPTLMLLADTATYLGLLAMRGGDTQAVTTSLNIHFLRRPPPADLLADVRLLRLGVRSAVAEVTLHSEGGDEPVAVATVGYAVLNDRKEETGNQKR